VSIVLSAGAERASRRKKRAELFPAQWGDGFGEEFYDHIMEGEIFSLKRGAPWQALKPSVPAPGVEQYRAPTEKELRDMIETLTREAAGGHAEPEPTG